MKGELTTLTSPPCTCEFRASHRSRHMEHLETLPKFAFSPNEAAVVSGLGITSIYSLMKRGMLKARKAGGRTLIFPEDLQECLRNLPARPIRE